MQRDSLHRFLIEQTNVRGEYVHLDDTWQQMLACSEYPEVIKQILGQALAATMLLSATLKFNGTLSLQVSGSGAVNLLLVQAHSKGTVRGLARWKTIPESSALPALFGDANLIITIEPSDGGERYQGIVSLQADTLTNALRDYFEQSEQLKTQLWLAVDDNSAAGLLLQRLPGEDDEGWNRSVQLADTVTDDELLSLKTETLLYRLYHEDQVRLFDAEDIRFECSCSQEKIEAMILSLGKQEADSMIEEQSEISINCEFCNKHYGLDAIDVKRIFSNTVVSGDSTVH